jgi:hypothetical protein
VRHLGIGGAFLAPRGCEGATTIDPPYSNASQMRFTTSSRHSARALLSAIFVDCSSNSSSAWSSYRCSSFVVAQHTSTAFPTRTAGRPRAALATPARPSPTRGGDAARARRSLANGCFDWPENVPSEPSPLCSFKRWRFCRRAMAARQADTAGGTTRWLAALLAHRPVPVREWPMAARWRTDRCRGWSVRRRCSACARRGSGDTGSGTCKRELDADASRAVAQPALGPTSSSIRARLGTARRAALARRMDE